jgi:hypothetical protein
MKQNFLNLKGLLALALGVVTIASTGCGRKEPVVPTLPSLVIKDANGNEVANNQTLNVAEEGGIIDLNIESNRGWTITEDAEWLTVAPASGSEGAKTVTFTATANDDEARTATATIATTTDGLTKTIKISQAGSVVPVGDITIKEIRDMGETTINVDKTLIATVISDAGPSGGNSASLRNVVVQDETAGIAIRLATDPTTNQFPVGDLISIKVNGLQIQKYYGLLQLNNVPLANLTKVGTNTIEHKEITAAEFVTGNYESQLVAVKEVQFASDYIGKAISENAVSVSLDMEASDKTKFIAYFTKWTTFLSSNVPEGSGTIKGIASAYIPKDETVPIIQIQPQTYSDIAGLTGERFAEEPRFDVSKEKVTVSGEGGNATVDVTGNVAWTVTVKDGGANLTGDPTPMSGEKNGTITLNFIKNNDTQNKKEVTITVSTEADVAKKSFDVVFEQNEGRPEGGANIYKKVTTAPADWSGEYLIVYEADSLAFNGSLAALDAVGNYKAVTITDGTITSDTTTDAYKFTIATVEGGYSIQSASGYYIAGKSGSGNGLSTSDSQAYVNTISLDGENAIITSSNGTILKFYKSGDQSRFRFYGSTQQLIALYKWE